MSISQQGSCQEQLKRGPHASDAIFIPLRSRTHPSAVEFALTAEILQKQDATNRIKTSVLLGFGGKRHEVRLGCIKQVRK